MHVAGGKDSQPYGNESERIVMASIPSVSILIRFLPHQGNTTHEVTYGEHKQ